MSPVWNQSAALFLRFRRATCKIRDDEPSFPAMSDSASERPAGPRRVALPFWILGILYFPWGIFLVLGMARLLSWTRCVLLTLTSFASALVGVQIIFDLKNTHASDLSLSLASAAGVVMYFGWGNIIYEIGQKAEYWSPRAQWSWRCASWIGIFFLSFCAVTVALVILAPETGSP
jgi:hypothetical protein